MKPCLRASTTSLSTNAFTLIKYINIKYLQSETRHVDINCRNAEGLTPLLLVTRDAQLFEKVGNRILRGYDAIDVVNELLKNRA